MSVAVDTDAILSENVVAPLADDQNAIPIMEGNPDGLNDASSAPKQTQEVDPLTLLKQQANTTIDSAGHQVVSILEEKPSDVTAIGTSLIDEDIQPIELTAESNMNGMNGQVSAITPVEGPIEVAEANAEVPQIAAKTTNGDLIAPPSDQAVLQSDPGRSSPGDQNHIEASPTEDAAAESAKEDIKEGEVHSVVGNSAETEDAVKESLEEQPLSPPDDVKVADNEGKLVDAVSADAEPLRESGEGVTEEPTAVAATIPNGSESSTTENSPSDPAPANSMTDTVPSAQGEETVPGSAESEGDPQDASAEATQKSSVAAVEEPSTTEVKSEQLEEIAISGQPGESKDGKPEVADEVVEENVELQTGAIVPSEEESGGSQQNVEDILVEETRVDVEKPTVEAVENNTVNIEATPEAAPDAVIAEEPTVTSVDNQTDQLIAEENQHPSTAADEHVRSEVAEVTAQPEENPEEEPGVPVEEVPARAEAVIHETDGTAGHPSVEQAAAENKLEESVPVVESGEPSLGPKHEDAAAESITGENSPAMQIMESQAEAPVDEPIEPAAVGTVMDSLPSKTIADAAPEESPAVAIATEDSVVETSDISLAAQDTVSAPKDVQEDDTKPEDDVSASPNEVDAPVETPAEVLSQPEESMVVVDPVTNEAATVLQPTHDDELQDHAAAQPVVEKGDEIPPAEVSDQTGDVSSPQVEVAEVEVDAASVPAETNVDGVVSTTEQSASEQALTTAEEPTAPVDADASPAPEQPPSAEVMAEAPAPVHVEEVPKEDVLEGATAAIESAGSVEYATHEESAPVAEVEVAAVVQEPSVESSETPEQTDHVVSADEVTPAPESHEALALESQVAEEVAPEQVHEDAPTEKLPAAEIANSDEKVEAAEVDSQVEPEPEAVAEEEPAQQPEVAQDADPETVKVHDAVEQEMAEAPAADESVGAEAPAEDIASEPSETISIMPVPAEEASVEPTPEAAAAEEKVDEHAVVEPELADGEAAQPAEDTLEPALEVASAVEDPGVAVEEESVAPAPSLAEEQRLHSEVEVVQKVPLDAEIVAEKTVEETITMPEAIEPVAKDAQQDAPSVEAVVDTTVETAVVEQPAVESIPAEQPVQNQRTEESAPSLAVVEQEPKTEDTPEEPHVKDVKVEEAQVAQDSDVPADIEKTQEITEVTAEPAVPEITQESVLAEEASQSELTTDQIPVGEPSASMTIQEDDLAKGENGQEEKVESVQSTQDNSEITSTEEIVKEAPELVAQIDETPAVPVDIVKELETAAAERADAIKATPIVTQLEQPVEASEPVEADETGAAKIEQAEGIPSSNDVASDTLSAQPELSPEARSDDIAERETQEPTSGTVPQTELVTEEAENRDTSEAAQEIVEPLTEDTKPVAAEQPLLETSDIEPKAPEAIPVAPEASFAMDKISLPTSVEGDAAMEDIAEDVDQKLDANEEIPSFVAEAAIPVSTDLATIDVASPTVDVAVDTVQNAEQTKNDGLNATVTAHIERPKSPWTPSFQVTTVGGGATPPEEPEKPEDHVLVEPAEDALASAADIINASETPQTAEDLPAEPAQSATPQLVLDTSSLEPEVPEATRPWTPSYSVHSQGSPRLEVSELAAVDASEEREEPPRPWTPTYSVHSQGGPQYVSQDFVQQDVTIKDESEGLAQESTPAEVQEEVRDKDLASIVEQHPVIEEASAEGEISTVVEEVKPVEEAPAVEEVEPVDEAPVVEQAEHVGQAPIVEVESTAEALAVHLAIGEPVLESENQSQETQVVDPLALHEMADENILDDVNATQDVPKLVVATSNEASMQEAGASDPMKDGTDRPKSPSWVHSYSVSVQGSPLQETAKLGEEQSADIENVVNLADAAPAATGALSFVRPDVHLDEPEVTSDVAKASGPTQTVSAADEVLEKPEKETASNSDAKGETTEIPPIVTDSVNLETPQNTERPKSPWTPSYSVTVQGAGQNADEELDTLEPLPQRAAPLPDGPALTKKDDIPNELGTRLAFSHSTETFVTAIEVPDEMKTSIASLKPADKTEDDATRSPASKEQNQEAFPSVEDAVGGQKLSKLNVSRLVSVSEAERSDVTSATTEATSSSPSTRKRLESTTSSRFFPGGWTSTAAKTVGEGRTSLEIAQGEFISGKAPSTISTGDVPDVPEGSGGSTANESSDDSDDESEESVHETKRRWCIVM